MMHSTVCAKAGCVIVMVTTQPLNEYGNISSSVDYFKGLARV